MQTVTMPPVSSPHYWPTTNSAMGDSQRARHRQPGKVVAPSAISLPAGNPLQLEDQYRCADQRGESGGDEPEVVGQVLTSPRSAAPSQHVHGFSGLRLVGVGIAVSATQTSRSTSDRRGQPSSFLPASDGTSSKAGASGGSSPCATGLLGYHRCAALKPALATAYQRCVALGLVSWVRLGLARRLCRLRPNRASHGRSRHSRRRPRTRLGFQRPSLRGG